MRTLRTQQKAAVVILFGAVAGLIGLAYGAAVQANLACPSAVRCLARPGVALSAAAGILPIEASPGAVSAVTPLPKNPANSADARARVNRAYGRLPLSFEANRGQADSRVRFLSHGQGYRVLVTATETVLVLRQPSTVAAAAVEKSAGTHAARAEMAAGTTAPTVLTMTLVGANPEAPGAGMEKLPGKVNYFIGNDPARWHTDVPTYAKVESRNVYPGIDMIHRGNQRQLEYDFVVAPGADPGDIRVSFSGMQKMHLDAAGDLVLTTPAGEIRQPKPYIYQEKAGVKEAVAGGYVLEGSNEIRFSVGAYDASLPLVLDPVLGYSTYLGGNPNDEGRGIAVDADGNAYIAGVTSSPSTFPKVGGIATVNGGLDAFVTKLNAAGDLPIYSTFLGHDQSEAANAIAVDDNGEAYVTGFTRSAGFPTTPSGYPTSGTFSAFVTRLNAAGNALVYSTRLGGHIGAAGQFAMQEGLGIGVDSTGHAYVTGWTTTANFPIVNGFQGSNGGQIDAFMAKLNTNASGAAALVYSTYLGGGTADHGVGIAVDETGHAYVTGRTDSGGTAPFPTFNPIQGTLAGGFDAFVAKLDTMVSGASSLVYSTYLGGSDNENQFTPWPGGIAVDSTGHAYVTGGTNSASSDVIPFPTTSNAYQQTTAGLGDQDAFLTKLNPAGTEWLYSTLFGGTGNDIGRGVAVDSTGHAYVTGEAGTPGTDFPRRNAVQPAFGGGPLDAFVAKIDTGASGDASLIHSTFFGGGSTDLSFAIALDSTGNAYVTGKTNSAGIATAGAYQTSFTNLPGGTIYDAFIAKIEETPRLVSLTLNPTSVTGSKPSKATVALSQPAPAAGVVVNLTSSNTSVATVPATITIAAGLTSGVVTVTTKAVATTTTVDISASYDGVTRTQTLTVFAPALKSLSLSPSSFAGGCGPAVGKVTLTGKAPTGGVVVSLADTNPAATVPASVTVPAGAVSATFTITAPAVVSNQTGNVTATLGGINKSKPLTVRPIGVKLLGLSPNPVVGPNSVTGTVTLECSAAPGNIVVTLSSSNPAVAAPAVGSITIPSGSPSGTFTVTTADVSVVSSAVIKATAGGLSKSVTLTVNP